MAGRDVDVNVTMYVTLHVAQLSKHR